MEKNYFLAFFIIALVAGLSLGLSLHDNITGKASSPISSHTFDSDDGLNVDIQGFCQDFTGGYVDYCLETASGTILMEYMYNEAQGCFVVPFDCRKAGYEGCNNGQCVSGRMYIND